VVLAHPFWALETFPVCFSFLSCWKNRAPSMGTKWSSCIWKKKHTIRKKKYMCRMMISLCHWALNEQMDKTGKIVTLYWRELFKKIPRFGTFCTQSVNEGLSRNWLLLSSGRSYMAPSWEPKIPRILIRYRLKTFFIRGCPTTLVPPPVGQLLFVTLHETVRRHAFCGCGARMLMWQLSALRRE